jgi:sugar lactone lactonase YvrE
MGMRLDQWAPAAVPALAVSWLVVAPSCGGDDNGGAPLDAGADLSSDASDGGLAAPVFLAHFDNSHLPEGLWKLGDAGPPVVGFTTLGTLATVTPAGGWQPFATVAAAMASNSNTLGITTDANGNVYVGVGSFTTDAGPIPPPGIYMLAPTGGRGTLFSSAPGMNFPNGLEFVGNTLFVADSGGAIYTVDATGSASMWSADPLLYPEAAACGGAEPGPVGANGIVHDANNVYLTNSNHGWIVEIPILSDGRAGAAMKIVDDCALAGADGLVLDTKDNTLLVAVNVQNKIVRVSMDGSMSTIAAGAPLDFPASVIIDSAGGSRRLLFTNLALASGQAGRPGLLAMPIP